MVVLLSVVATKAQAAEPTVLRFLPAGPVSVDYSQAVNLVLAFEDAQGVPLDGATACGAGVCRVEVEATRADGAGDVIQITAPDVAIDSAGRAQVRFTVVDGRYNDAAFAAAAAGLPYVVSARFRGAPLDAPPSQKECASPTPDGRLCAATASATVNVFPEVPALAFAGDIVMRVGDTVTLAATLSDETGDADPSGTDIDGSSARVLAGMPVSFFYDIDDDGGPSGNEWLGEATTNDFGVAAFQFTADPEFATAGIYDAGIHAEFPGDERYGFARTSVKLTLHASDLDPARTIIEVDPEQIEGDGVSEATIRVRLVDVFGNLLGADADDHDVELTTDLGLLRDAVKRDVLDGTYAQQLRAQRRGGTATIQVNVDGVAGPTATLRIIAPPGCGCLTSPDARRVPLSTLLPFCLWLVVRRRSGTRR